MTNIRKRKYYKKNIKNIFIQIYIFKKEIYIDIKIGVF